MEKKLKIHSNDELVHDVIRKFDERSAAGFRKYGSTLRGDNDSLFRWVNDIQEELMDAILYIQKVKETLTEESQEKMIKEIDTAEYMYNRISDYPGCCQQRSIYPGDTWVSTCTCQ